MNSPRRNVAPFVFGLALGLGALAYGWRQADVLTVWAEGAGLPFTLAAAAALLAAAIVVARSYAQLRQPALYALVLVLLPWGLLQPFYYANAEGQRFPAASAGPAAITITVEDAAKTGPGEQSAKSAAEPSAPAADRPPSRRFVGLPDGLAKRYPELPGDLRVLMQRLHALGFLLFPWLVLLATPLRAVTVRKRLRTLTLLILGAQAICVAAIFALPGGEVLVRGGGELKLVLLASYAGAVAASLLLWRSPGGVGGVIAALLVLVLPAAMAHHGVPTSALGLADVKDLPFGVERALMLAFPVVVLAITAREWILSMSHKTQHDALTQVFNKAYADAIVNQTIATDLGRCYSVALLDIDHFKKVNDTHGHGAGDVVLTEVAKTISDTVHNRGLVCRTGGEEITVFFPGVDQARAQAVCEEVRIAVEELEVPTHDNEGRRVALAVTLSVGVASNLDRNGNAVYERVQDVVAAADRAVYEAKSSGRNQVVRD